MRKNIFLIFFSIISFFGVTNGQGLQNPLQNLPKGTELTIRSRVNIPANSSVVELAQPSSYDVDHFKSLSLVLHMSSEERVIDKNTSFTINSVEYLSRRDRKEGTFKVKMYYGDKREFFLCYFYPEQSPKIAALQEYFKVDLPRASSYDSN